MTANDARRRPGWQDPGPAGPLMAEGADGASTPLAWLPDVADHCAQTRPPMVVIRHLVQVLKDRPGLALFELERDNWARPVTADKVWRAARAASPERWESAEPTVRFRDGAIRTSWLHRDGFSTPRRRIPAVTAQTELRGAPGAVVLLDELAQSGQPASALRRHPVFRLAILASDAAALFGYGVAPVANPAPVVLLRLADAAPAGLAVQHEAPELKPAKAPHEKWTPAHRAELLRQFKALQDHDPRAAVAGLHAQLGEAWGYKQNSVKNFLADARKEGKPPTSKLHRA